MNERKAYIRHVTHREPINRFGKLGYVEHIEAIEATDEELAKANFGKRIRFEAADLNREDPAAAEAVAERMATHNKGMVVDCAFYDYRKKEWRKVI